LLHTTMCLQLAYQSVCYPAGIAEDIPVWVRNFFNPWISSSSTWMLMQGHL
jgi:hypothetical protein